MFIVYIHSWSDAELVLDHAFEVAESYLRQFEHPKRKSWQNLTEYWTQTVVFQFRNNITGTVWRFLNRAGAVLQNSEKFRSHKRASRAVYWRSHLVGQTRSNPHGFQSTRVAQASPSRSLGSSHHQVGHVGVAVDPRHPRQPRFWKSENFSNFIWNFWMFSV